MTAELQVPEETCGGQKECLGLKVWQQNQGIRGRKKKSSSLDAK